MMGGSGHEHGCERARAWASLELDGELSPLERALLESHVRRCPACATATLGMRAATGLLRAAPAEAPSRPLFQPVERRPRHRTAATRLALAAALAALAAGLGVLAGSTGGGSGSPAPALNSDIAFLPSSDAERDLRGSRNTPSGPLVQPLGPSRSGLSGV